MKYYAPYGSIDPDAPYVDRNTPGATRGSVPPAAAIEDPQRELVALITKAGISASDADLFQVLKAIRSCALNYRAATGTANALVVALDPAITVAPPAGLELTIVPPATNTGAAALNAGWGAAPLTTMLGAAISAGTSLVGVPMRVHWTGSAWLVMGAGGPSSRGALINIQRFDTPGTATYIPTAGTRFVEVDAQGGGGAGGGCPATPAGTVSCASAGGSGAWARKIITSGFAGVTVTVGAAGVGTSGGAGGNGGASAFGVLVAALGGAGGLTAGPAAMTDTILVDGGAAGALGTSGDINSPGIKGDYTIVTNQQGLGASPTPSTFGGGFGAGGGGGANPPSTAAKVGLAGKPGVVIVREYA